MIRSEIDEFGFVHSEHDSKESIFYKGASAFDKLIDSLPDMITYVQSKNLDPVMFISQLGTLKLLLISISTSIDLINNSKTSTTDKRYLLSILSYQYQSKIKTAFEAKLQQYKIAYSFQVEPNENTESVFTNSVFDIIKEIDSKI